MAEFNIKAPLGANRNKKVVGRGQGCGNRKTSGRGHKGQKARSGGGTRLGFEGGQMPLYRRLAARGFSNHPFKKEYIVVNTSSIEKNFDNDEVVSLESLCQKGLIKKTETQVKILGNGELTKKVTVEGLKVSSGAKDLIEKAGGSVNIKTEQQG